MLVFFLIFICLFFIAFYFHLSDVISKKIILFLFVLKTAFVFAVSFLPFIQKHSLFNIPDEDNYFHDAKIFHQLAIKYPIYYFQFWLDIEPENTIIFNKYYTQTNAFYKAPEFFYNDNRWVVKIHSLLDFIANGNISIHRLISSFISILGLILMYNFLIKIFRLNLLHSLHIYCNATFLIASLFPSFFFFTSFVLKESWLLLLIGLWCYILPKILIENIYKFTYFFYMMFLLWISLFFRPAYVIPFIMITSVFLWVKKNNRQYPVPSFLSILIVFLFMIIFSFKLIFKKDIVQIIQYRQERFLDASKGGIFLLNTKKFVRIPYDWKNLIIDSLQNPPKMYIKKDVPMMYWLLTNLQDTIIEKNKDTTDYYHILYYITRANKTIDIPTINFQKNISYNIRAVISALNVFFFYPKKVENISDFIVLTENIFLIMMIIVLLNIFTQSKFKLNILYGLILSAYYILIIAITSPNIGAIERYRYFILPYLFSIMSFTLMYKNTSSINTLLNKITHIFKSFI